VDSVSYFWWHAIGNGQVNEASTGESQQFGVNFIEPLTIVRWRYSWGAYGTHQWNAGVEIPFGVPPLVTFFAGYDPAGGHLGTGVNPYVDNEFDYAVLDEISGTTSFNADLSGTGWRITFNADSGPRRNSEARRRIQEAHPHPFFGVYVSQNVGDDVYDTYQMTWRAAISILYQTVG
jgi:hypothetical protein